MEATTTPQNPYKARGLASAWRRGYLRARGLDHVNGAALGGRPADTVPAYQRAYDRGFAAGGGRS